MLLRGVPQARIWYSHSVLQIIRGVQFTAFEKNDGRYRYLVLHARVFFRVLGPSRDSSISTTLSLQGTYSWHSTQHLNQGCFGSRTRCGLLVNLLLGLYMPSSMQSGHGLAASGCCLTCGHGNMWGRLQCRLVIGC